MTRIDTDAIRYADKSERDALASLAVGRLLRLGSRPFQEGDIEQYEDARAVILACADPEPDYRPNYARDRFKGAAGD